MIRGGPAPKCPRARVIRRCGVSLRAIDSLARGGRDRDDAPGAPALSTSAANTVTTGAAKDNPWYVPAAAFGATIQLKTAITTAGHITPKSPLAKRA